MLHYHVYAWDVHCLGGSLQFYVHAFRPFPHDTMKCVPLRASAWASLLTCVERRLVQVQVDPFPISVPTIIHTHICTSKPLAAVLGLNFRDLLIIPSAHSLPLLQSILHIVIRYVTSLPCSKIFSDPLLLKVCNFSFTALMH